MTSDENQAGRAKVAEIVKDVQIAMLTTIDDDGHLVSRPMAVQQVEFDGDLWFVSDGDARKVNQIRHGARTNVSFSSNGAWLSIAGDAQVLNDRQKLDELWNPALSAWFPDGPDTPGIALVKIHADTAEYWDAPGSKVTTLISYVKAKVKGERAEVGENKVVDL
ncbi:pyridoxamine 5'-phosphate oxidase family protein [Kineosporia rhizophila]|uniref:pyridoxamine 5'-phosphate oxidase family protein n=1 Tax=Kineosporia rhizophila TaxID=84633 RepID=UPI000AA4392D|nr:pyridoxamine 5'-phosphate oxidase family protein [Kineosporia rhizophila]MCE0540494.1 pyridoxamine 5'-phosphate oxidase family protein [Kineosporia rhizophila]